MSGRGLARGGGGRGEGEGDGKHEAWVNGWGAARLWACEFVSS